MTFILLDITAFRLDSAVANFVNLSALARSCHLLLQIANFIEEHATKHSNGLNFYQRFHTAKEYNQVTHTILPLGPVLPSF